MIEKMQYVKRCTICNVKIFLSTLKSRSNTKYCEKCRPSYQTKYHAEKNRKNYEKNAEKIKVKRREMYKRTGK